MAADGEVGYGTKLEYKVGAGSFAELANVLDLEPPSIKVKMAQYQILRATRWLRKKAATGEVGDCKITLLWTAAVVLALNALLFDETLTFKITKSDGSSTEQFAGLIMEIGRPIKVDDMDAIEVTLAVDNSVSLA